MIHVYAPGPGDLLPPFSGHPHDPRAPEQDDDDDVTKYTIADVKYFVDLAARTEAKGDMANARKHLEKAKAALDELLEPAL
jgi:hypothetical protein